MGAVILEWIWGGFILALIAASLVFLFASDRQVEAILRRFQRWRQPVEPPVPSVPPPLPLPPVLPVQPPLPEKPGAVEAPKQ